MTRAKCPACKGTGRQLLPIPPQHRRPGWPKHVLSDCPPCRGCGKITVWTKGEDEDEDESEREDKVQRVEAFFG